MFNVVGRESYFILRCGAVFVKPHTRQLDFAFEPDDLITPDADFEFDLLPFAQNLSFGLRDRRN
jgi:hypothetical protein